MAEYEVEDIISSSGDWEAPRPSSYAAFMNEVQKLGMGSLGETANLRNIEDFCHKVRFSKNGCSVLEPLDEVRELKAV